MPIDYEIDHANQLVVAYAQDKLTDDEILAYQRNVWSQPELAEYDELVDLSKVEAFDTMSAGKMREIAALGASLDSQKRAARTAMIASPGLHFGLIRMYETFRQLDPESTRTIHTFSSREEALHWLGVEGKES